MISFTMLRSKRMWKGNSKQMR